jgi:hypothetical protein
VGTAARAWRDAEDDREDTPPPPRRPPLLEALDGIQRTAGNHAARSLLARRGEDADAGAATGEHDADPAVRRVEVLTAPVATYVERERGPLTRRIRQGVSLTEIVEIVLREVPEARELPVDVLAAELRRLFAPLRIRDHTDGPDHPGLLAELESLARTAVPSLGRRPEIGGDRRGFLRLGLSGTATGGRVDQTATDDDRWTVGAALSTRADGFRFEAKLLPPNGGGPPRWEVALQFPADRGLAATLDGIPALLADADLGLRESCDVLRNRGDRGIAAAASHLSEVRTAVQELSAVAADRTGSPIDATTDDQDPDAVLSASVTAAL